MQYVISDTKSISARRFDDEVVVANFVTGVYYSLFGPAAEIWNGLGAGFSIDQIVDLLHGLPHLPKAEILVQAEKFVDDLAAEGLIRLGSSAIDSSWKPQVSADQSWPPKLEKFSDMQDLLLLDPVHDVTDAGWPHEKLDSKS